MHWKIGLAGFGNVGKAFVSLYLEMKEFWKEKLKTSVAFKFILNSRGGIYIEEGIPDETLKEAINSKEGIRGLKGWKEGLRFEDVIGSSEINLFVEVSPTNIRDGEPALSYIKSALKKGIHVVTGNKGPFLHNYKELFDIAREKEVLLGIGCTAGAALPSINFGNYSLSGAKIERIEGVLNGVCNYILTTMEEKGLTFDNALENAQKMGIAETDPSLDIDGWDTAAKILIIANSLMGSSLTLKDIPVEGIRGIDLARINELRGRKKRLKLVGLAQKEGEKVKAEVKLLEVEEGHFLYELKGTNKGVLYKCYPAGEFLVKGGASSPEGAAYSLWRDIFNFSPVLYL